MVTAGALLQSADNEDTTNALADGLTARVQRVQSLAVRSTNDKAFLYSVIVFMWVVDMLFVCSWSGAEFVGRDGREVVDDGTTNATTKQILKQRTEED
jgi:hypothetical protein